MREEETHNDKYKTHFSRPSRPDHSFKVTDLLSLSLSLVSLFLLCVYSTSAWILSRGSIQCIHAKVCTVSASSSSPFYTRFMLFVVVSFSYNLCTLLCERDKWVCLVLLLLDLWNIRSLIGNPLFRKSLYFTFCQDLLQTYVSSIVIFSV